MKNIKNFIFDFVGYFILLLGSVAIAIAEIVTQIIFTLQKFWDGIVKPALVDMLADAHLLLLIALQSWYETAAKVCLIVSKCLNRYAKFALHKSEQLVYKTWIH